MEIIHFFYKKSVMNCSFKYKSVCARVLYGQSDLERSTKEGDSPVCDDMRGVCQNKHSLYGESGSLGVEPKVRGKSLVTLNSNGRPIANK